MNLDVYNTLLQWTATWQTDWWSQYVVTNTLEDAIAHSIDMIAYDIHEKTRIPSEESHGKLLHN